MTSSSTLRVAVVTGAARGIGLATAHWFLKHGYQVALIDNDAPTLANSIVDQNATEDTAYSFTLPGNTFADNSTGDVRPVCTG